ncbi:redoxin [Bacteriovorax sp. BAL6_X]|uniref:redoxin domain-containing protein n=1 Tax=Bacteriovorax sp. BAL6_X TaxID=1201290 RepID=UPI000386ABF5|nr:redoxin domain-containing protein [Bacteriovorax sp. BAL6_X]EPZ50765.1 redoxin [Bacteriovorax sp. BAL6_X]
MKILVSLLMTTLTLALSPGDKAPQFSLKNQNNEIIKLSTLKGEKVILEWYNDGCPFVRKHYDSMNMQQTQKLAKERGYHWLSINSSNVGKQGYIKDAQAATNRLKIEKSHATHFLIDTDGTVGKLYNAKTTPEIFIINENGIIEYMGAIDSIPSADKSDIQNARNYVRNALDQLKENKKVSPARTKPYGCSVKY